jgi:hypothetical protein
MKAIIVNENYLDERFEAFINRVKVAFSEAGFLDSGECCQLVRSFNYHAHRFKEDIVGAPFDGKGK